MTATLHTLQEAADLLRVGHRTVRDNVYQGRWPHVALSPRKRFMTDDDIEATLELLHKEAQAVASTISDARTQKKIVLSLLEAA